MKKIRVSILFVLGMGSLCASDAQLVALGVNAIDVQAKTDTESENELVTAWQPQAPEVQVSQPKQEKYSCTLFPCCPNPTECMECKSEKMRNRSECFLNACGIIFLHLCCCCR